MSFCLFTYYIKFSRHVNFAILRFASYISRHLTFAILYFESLLFRTFSKIRFIALAFFTNQVPYIRHSSKVTCYCFVVKHLVGRLKPYDCRIQDHSAIMSRVGGICDGGGTCHGRKVCDATLPTTLSIEDTVQKINFLCKFNTACMIRKRWLIVVWVD